MVLGAENAHLELTDGDKAVVILVGKVHKMHGRAFLACLTVNAYAGIFQQQGEGVVVVLNQIAAWEAGGKLFDYLFYLIIFQPWIDDLELLVQNRQHDHFGETLAVAVAGVLFVLQVDYVPAQLVKLGK